MHGGVTGVGRESVCRCRVLCVLLLLVVVPPPPRGAKVSTVATRQTLQLCPVLALRSLFSSRALSLD